MNYDTSLFIQIIESEGITFVRADFQDGVSLRFYKGRKGKLVPIDTSYEVLTPSEGIGYLSQLGLEHLIPIMFGKLESF